MIKDRVGARPGKNWSVLENIPLLDKRNGDHLQAAESVAVIGAAGQIGELFTRTLASVVPVEAVVRESRWRDEADHPEVRFYTNIASMLAIDPEVVVLATQNPTQKALEEVAKHAQRPFTLMLPQNGVDVVDQAEEILKDCRDQVTLVRASLFTNASHNENGNLIYNPNKKRIALASVGEDKDNGLLKVGNMLSKAGFDVRLAKDYKLMEWSKLVVNLLGSTSTITGLSPLEAFSDPEIFTLEHRALKDRFEILKAAGIEVDDSLWNIGKLRWLAKIPGPMAVKFRGVLAEMYARERNNQLPSAARQINNGEKALEPINYYHMPIAQLGRKYSKVSPVDEAMMDILRRHGRDTDNLSLNYLGADERKKILLKVFNCETKKVFVRGHPLLERTLKLGAESLYGHYTDSFEIIGVGYLMAVAECLGRGKSVVLAPNHRSHVDHLAIMKALRKGLPEEARKYHVYILAGMKFEEEMLSALFSCAYPHPVVKTLTVEDGEEERWEAQIINRRADKKIKSLLQEPCIFVEYVEGGRSKQVLDGEVQLQKPALGASAWLLDPLVGLVVPTVITGTEKIKTPGTKWLKHGDTTIEFCEGIATTQLKDKAIQLKRQEFTPEQIDGILSSMILDQISAKLPSSATRTYNAVY